MGGGVTMDVLTYALSKKYTDRKTAIRQTTKFGVVAPHSTDLTVPATVDFRFRPVGVLKFVGSEGNKIITAAEFSNGEEDDFEANEFIEFDGTMHKKTDYTSEVTEDGALGEGRVFSAPLGVTRFKTISSLVVS